MNFQSYYIKFNVASFLAMLPGFGKLFSEYGTPAYNLSLPISKCSLMSPFYLARASPSLLLSVLGLQAVK